LLLAGTKKGLFLFTSTDRANWELNGPFQTGRQINHAIYDSRGGLIYATANDAWFGCEVVRSPDFGKSWQVRNFVWSKFPKTGITDSGYNSKPASVMTVSIFRKLFSVFLLD